MNKKELKNLYDDILLNCNLAFKSEVERILKEGTGTRAEVIVLKSYVSSKLNIERFFELKKEYLDDKRIRGKVD